MNVITADEVEQIFDQWGLHLKFDAEERASLPHTTAVVVDSTRVLAFPTPVSNVGLNILNLRRLLGVNPSKPPSFFDHPWYLQEPFGERNCTPGWHLLHMEVLPATIQQSYNYYHSLSAQNCTLPTAIEATLMIFLHFERTGERLLINKHTWCSDEASMGRLVTVGAFGRNGLFVSGHPPVFASRGLGICAKIRN